MRDFPSCFGESGVQIAADNSSKTANNQVTCLYQSLLNGQSCVINITWNKTMTGQGLSVGIEDTANNSLCKVDIKPWLFSKRKGSKRLDADSTKVDVFWDLCSAKYGSGPEPVEGYYVAVLFDFDMVLLLGDLTKEALRKTSVSSPMVNAAFVSRKEHIVGKSMYSTKAQFCDHGHVHDIVIECDTIGLKDPILEIRIDGKRVMQVKRLTWKFRGNQTILIDRMPVEVFWDVHNWLFSASLANAVFMFQTCVSSEKLLPWSLKESQLRSIGFSLVLYAWKNE